jgi:hypothetical protein
MKAKWIIAVGTLVVALLHGTSVIAAGAESSADVYRQSLDEAWWTGPLLASGAGTLPPGHLLIEPYLFDVIGQGRYDHDGNRQAGDRTHSYGSLTYLLYGLTDRVTIGLIPRFGFNDVNGGADSSGIGLGDFTFQAQYRLAQFREGARVPTISLLIAETVPSGEYDRLGLRPSDGLGAGAYTTTLSLNSQYFFWMPNGRILRMRFNTSYGFSNSTRVRDASVYGTSEGFRGRARPGDSLTLNAAWEYSLTQRWVLALDAIYQHFDNTSVRGFDFSGSQAGLPPTSIELRSGSSETVSFAPAIEYNWSSRFGVIAGAIFTASGRNASANVIPVAAINMFF